jgi:molecular chaperone IbpA
MRGFDLSPLYRSTVGFDSFASMLDRAAGFDSEASTYPPYNIEHVAENDYRITMAVAGFVKSDIKIEVKEDTLSIRGEKKEVETERTFLHRGIASRAFETRFQLADHVEVRGADVEGGLLSIDLKREVPERLKSRTIEIGAVRANGFENKSVDASAAAKLAG